jgi:undecaprenyl-diphosphatase
LGTVFNQFLKLWFRIPRPWVKDPEFTIVESARAEATGYSFPSGHTQSSVGMFGAVARWNKNAVLRTVAIILCVLVPVSRLYLGVHTPLDVLVSTVIALLLVFLFYPVITKALEKPNLMRILLFVMFLLSVGYVLFVEFYHFPADVDLHNFQSGLSNGYKMLGCILGLILSFEIDTRFTKFETSAVWWAQVLKLVLGLVPIILIKTFLKTPLLSLFGGHEFASCVRYFLITAFAGCVWPISFKWFSKLGRK